MFRAVFSADRIAGPSEQSAVVPRAPIPSLFDQHPVTESEPTSDPGSDDVLDLIFTEPEPEPASGSDSDDYLLDYLNNNHLQHYKNLRLNVG